MFQNCETKFMTKVINLFSKSNLHRSHECKLDIKAYNYSKK